jgi:hypothetical protein
VGGIIASGGVDAAFSLLHGDVVAARSAGLQSIANAVLNAASGLPISFNQSYKVSAGQLFGSGVLYSHEKSDNLGFSVGLPGGIGEIVGGASVGMFHNKVSDTYRKNGFIVQREADGIGAMAKASAFSVSAGWYNGVESYQPKTTQYVDNSGRQVNRTDWGERSFEGEFDVRINAGDRLFSKALLPALRSVEHFHWYETLADGSAFRRNEGLPYSILTPTPDRSTEENSYLSIEEYLLTRSNQPIAVQGDGSSVGSDSSQSGSGQTSKSGEVTNLPYIPAVAPIEVQPANTHPNLSTPNVDPVLRTKVGDLNDTINLKVSSVVAKSFQSSRHQKLYDKQGPYENVKGLGGDLLKQKQAFGAFKSRTETRYEYGTHVETSTDQFSKVNTETNIVTLTTTRTEVSKDYQDTIWEKIKKGNIFKSKTREYNYSPGERRVWGSENRLDVKAVSELDVNGAALSTRETHLSDSTTAMDKVFERFFETDAMNSQTFYEVKNDNGIVSTSMKRSDTTISEDGQVKIVSNFNHVSHDAFSDTRMEMKDGVTTYYEPGQRRDIIAHTGDDDFASIWETKVDGSIFSRDDIGVQESNGVRGNATFEVTACESNSLNSKQYHGEDVSAQALLKKQAHGGILISRIGDLVVHAAETASELHGEAATTSHQVNSFASGTASSLVRDFDSETHDNNYKVGEADLSFQIEELSRQTIVSTVATEPVLLGHTTTTYDKGVRTTVGEYVCRRDDVLLEKFDIKDNPNVSINDIPALPVDQGGVANESQVPDPPTNLVTPSSISRTRYDGGYKLENTYERNTGHASLFANEFDDLQQDSYYSIQVKSDIVSGTGDDAVLANTVKITDADPYATKRTNTNTKVKWGVKTITKSTTTTGDASKIEPETTTTYSASGGVLRGVGAAGGAGATMLLELVVDKKVPSAAEAGHAMVNIMEAAAMGEVMDMITMSGDVSIHIEL